MTPDDRCTDDECRATLDTLFPGGPAGDDVLCHLAPEGWERSPLVAVYHPGVAQLHAEAVGLHRNLMRLARGRATERLETPEPTMEEVRAKHQDVPADATVECADLVTRCLWDVFSDNHEVRAPDGRLVDLGSFRGSAGFLAEWLDARASGAPTHDYMDFYMGTVWIAQRADLTPVYELIFDRLKRHGFDWTYQFPRLQVVDLRPLRDELKPSDEPEWANYDPSAAVADEQRDREIAAMRAELDQAAAEAAEAAAQHPPPPTVAAYHNVYGRFPRGWPPV